MLQKWISTPWGSWDSATQPQIKGFKCVFSAIYNVTLNDGGEPYGKVNVFFKKHFQNSFYVCVDSMLGPNVFLKRIQRTHYISFKINSMCQNVERTHQSLPNSLSLVSHRVLSEESKPLSANSSFPWKSNKDLKQGSWRSTGKGMAEAFLGCFPKKDGI